MELSNIKGIGPAKQTKLADAGVESVEQLARANVDELATSTGISAANLKDFKERAVALTLLEDVKGIGPATVSTLAQAGIRSLKDLANASVEMVSKEAKVAREKAEDWKTQAQELATHVRTEAKTAAGRKKLAAEGKDFADKTAKKVQATSKDLIEKAQKDGEAALAKAKAVQADIRDKAPERIKEAEMKIKETRDKANAAVKREVEKVKASNETFLARVKARFQKKQNA